MGLEGREKFKVAFSIAIKNKQYFCFCGVAEDLFVKAKELYPTCDNEVTTEENLLNEKSENYLKFTRKFISEIKEKFFKQPIHPIEPSIDDDLLSLNSDVVPLNAESIAAGDRPKNCTEILGSKYTKSGVYTIYPKPDEPLNVYCDMDTDGGGWTVIQRRAYYPGMKYFNLGWSFYKRGFGNLEKQFWLGNDNIYTMTNQEPCEIRFDLEDHKGERRFAVYKHFRIDDESRNYTLHIKGYGGNAGDGMKFHDGQRFATIDRDHLRGASVLQGAWWIYEWAYVHLNGIYIPGIDDPRSIHWYLWHKNEGLAHVEMKIRPRPS
ncbi:techylectin-5A [Caerostris darwini]|uniref:Techylectin-5A n=1 Tax=Caerostris darwini TaxID=1538125 RepID=A0AAV4QF74_9ARAC|nr:techylectin-5A [Caerostris darwini]